MNKKLLNKIINKNNKQKKAQNKVKKVALMKIQHNLKMKHK